MSNVIKQQMRKVNAVGAAVVVTILAATAAFGVVPLYRDGLRIAEKSTKLTKEIKELDALTVDVGRIESERASREARLAGAETRLPSAGAVNQFVQELTKVAEDSGFQVDAVQPGREVKAVGAYKSISVHIAGTGDWETCYRYLNTLRGANQKLARLDNLTMDSIKDGQSERPMCHLTVDISTFIVR